MSHPRRSSRQPPVRRLALAIAASGLLLFAALSLASRRDRDEAVRPSAPKVLAPSVTLRLAVPGRPEQGVRVDRYLEDGVVDEPIVRSLVRRIVPRRLEVRDGRRRVRFAIDREAVVQDVIAAGPDGGRVDIARRPIAATIAAPVFKQTLRNGCEGAALSILSIALGRPVSQATLQAAFPRSGTVDPVGTGADRVWGDPELGYVGRAAGGGVAGGFGVFEGPVRATAARFGMRLDDLSRKPAAAIYDRLRRGGAVMVWIGLSDGPYGEWTSPAGRPVRVNFGEHTVVLHGIREDGSVLVANPLEGTRERWTPAEFEAKWALLGRRALAGRGIDETSSRPTSSPATSDQPLEPRGAGPSYSA